MFSITSKAHYGIAATIELAHRYGNGVTQIKDIAERREIPKNYLEQIFNRLTKHGIIKSVRGKKGGYLLADDPALVSIQDHRIKSFPWSTVASGNTMGPC